MTLPLRLGFVVVLYVFVILTLSVLVCSILKPAADKLVMTEPKEKVDSGKSARETVESIKKKIVGAVNINAKRARYNDVCESYELGRNCSPCSIASIATECSLAGVAPADCRASILPNLPNRYA